jgi:hypothetical protein
MSEFSVAEMLRDGVSRMIKDEDWMMNEGEGRRGK